MTPVNGSEHMDTTESSEREWTVEESMTADHHGNPGFPVLATPALVGLIEIAALEQLATTLEPGEGSVGIELSLEHKAPTPVGETVRIRSVITERSGRLVTFAIDASDTVGTIASGTHRRAVVNRDAFRAKVKASR
jgi:predicted thioesterase